MFPGAVPGNRANVEEEEPLVQDRVELPANLPSMSSTTSEDVQNMIALGFDVDDDDAPAPENIPLASIEDTPSLTVVDEEQGLYESQSWGWKGFCDRESHSFEKNNPKLNGTPGIEIGQNMSYLSMFLLFFPRILIDLIVDMTSKTLKNNFKSEVTVGKFLRFLGLQLFMSTVTGFKRNDWWSSTPIEFEKGAPYRFGSFMSKARFDDIMTSLSFTDCTPPSYTDKFFEIRQMLKIWNENMSHVFSPGWICCLDESMSIWFGKYTCPGWVYCPRKPHPYGNEYHDISCGISGIIFIS